jgi:elongation factor Ts
MAVSRDAVKELREKTGVSVMECKRALEEAEGDMNKALTVLAEHATVTAGKKANRVLGAGTVSSYIHTQGQIGALVLLSCETDFVSKNEEFTTLAREIAMHAAAMQPQTTEELLTQPFIKDQGKTIADLISRATQKFGERIEVAKLSVFSVA